MPINNNNNNKESSWIQQHATIGVPLSIPEWEDEHFRKAEGWQGRDLVHHPDAPVHVHDYRVEYGPGDDLPPCGTKKSRGGAGTKLSGIVEFTINAESHQGLCHGGSMCSVMDDIVGWIAFCVTGDILPWSGYTVQVNTKLQAPVRVNSTLLLVAVVDRIERQRKVFVKAKLLDPSAVKNLASDDGLLHATCEGLVILNRGVLLPNGSGSNNNKNEEDAVKTTTTL